jgi:hypothetical protein
MVPSDAEEYLRKLAKMAVSPEETIEYLNRIVERCGEL